MVCAGLGNIASPALADQLNATGGMDYSVPWLRIILSLLFCFAIAAGAALLLRAYKTRHLQSLSLGKWRERLISRSRLEVLESRRISTHADVCLIRLDEREYLVLVGGGHSRLLNADCSVKPEIETEADVFEAEST